jgi:hypothetical protein
MELTKNLLWVYPAVIMTLWTLLTLLLAWTLPLNQRVPVIVPRHVLLLVLNPKDEYLYQRPSLLLALVFLVAGVIPVVCALMLAVHVLVSGLYGVEVFKQFKRKGTV